MKLKKARVMAERSITIKFDGQLHQVDLNTFTQVLLDYATVVHECAQELSPSTQIDVRIDATKKGSLDVVLSLVADGFSGMLTFLNDNQGFIEGLDMVFGASIGIFELKKWLAGKKKIDAIKDNGDGSSTVSADGSAQIVNNGTINVFTNKPAASHAVNSAFASLEENPAIDGLAMLSDDKILFRAERSEFADIATSPDYETDQIEHEQKRCTVTVVRPCLAKQKNRKWRIFYDNIQEIPAVITDENFMDNLNEYSFTIGTQMDVELDITKEFDPGLNAFVGKVYTITKVYEVIPPIETMRMF